MNASSDVIWDLAVVGAGPAGAAAALAALRRRPGARVLILDRAASGRDKACGDGIAPHALDVLHCLGLADLTADHRPVHRLRLGYPGGSGVTGVMSRPAYVIPRATFDARVLAGALAAGATFERRTVRRVEARPDRVVLDGDVAARVVVAADGAESAVRRGLGLARNGQGHLAVAIRGYAPVRPNLANEQRIAFGRGDWPAYAWSFPIGDGRANVGYGEVLRAGRPLTRARLLDRLEALLPGCAEDATAWRAHHLPLSSQRPRQPDGRVLLAGDALSLINPMTGEGIYYAVLSGACAGRAAVDAPIAETNPGGAYRADLDRRLGRHLRHTTLTAALARAPRLVDAALGAAARNAATFDTLVNMGLGQGLLTPGALARTARQLLAPGRHGRHGRHGPSTR
jgi:geranylgeranyl reductase family protein